MGDCWKAILIACLTSVLVRPSWGNIACPVSLADGKADQDGIVLSFRNIGKLPIQELVFNCLPIGNGAAIALLVIRKRGCSFRERNTPVLLLTKIIRGQSRWLWKLPGCPMDRRGY